MVYGGGGNSNSNSGVGDDGVGCDDWWAERTDPMLDSVSDLYSDSEISVDDSRPFSCPAYTVY